MYNIGKFRKRISNSKSNEFRMSMDDARALLAEIDQGIENTLPQPTLTPAPTPAPRPPQYTLDGGGFST